MPRPTGLAFSILSLLAATMAVGCGSEPNSLSGRPAFPVTWAAFDTFEDPGGFERLGYHGLDILIADRNLGPYYCTPGDGGAAAGDPDYHSVDIRLVSVAGARGHLGEYVIGTLGPPCNLDEVCQIGVAGVANLSVGPHTVQRIRNNPAEWAVSGAVTVNSFEATRIKGSFNVKLNSVTNPEDFSGSFDATLCGAGP